MDFFIFDMENFHIIPLQTRKKGIYLPYGKENEKN